MCKDGGDYGDPMCYMHVHKALMLLLLREAGSI